MSQLDTNHDGNVSCEEFVGLFDEALLPWEAREFESTIEDFMELAQWVRMEKRKMGKQGHARWGEWPSSSTHRQQKAILRGETRKRKVSNAAKVTKMAQ